MPPVFTEEFAQHLNTVTDIEVKEARHGEKVLNGVAYIAPGGFHLTVHGSTGCYEFKTNSLPPENSCRPAVDVLFRSVAKTMKCRGVLSAPCGLS